MSKCIKCGSEILTGDIHWEMGLCNNCYNEFNNMLYDLALEKNHGVPAPRGFGHHIDELNKKIADLEAKLAESEEKLKNAWSLIEEKDDELSAYYNDTKQLKQQLAESEEEIKKNKLEIAEINERSIIRKWKIDDLKQQLKEKDEQLKLIKWDYDVVTREYNKLFNTADSVIERQDQDKISFAVEQINKLKNDLDNNDKIIIRYCDFEEFDNIFEKRITELTHQHEGKGE